MPEHIRENDYSWVSGLFELLFPYVAQRECTYGRGKWSPYE